jgi:phosphate transport system permease protein
VLLLSTIVGQALPAFTAHQATIPVDLSRASLDPDNLGEEALRRVDYDAIVRDGIRSLFPYAESRAERRIVSGLLSSGAPVQLRRAVLEDPDSLIGQSSFPLPVDDVADLYFKGQVSDDRRFDTTGIASPTGTEGTIQVLSTANDFRELLADVKDFLAEQAEEVERQLASRNRSLEGAVRDLAQYRDASP